MTDTDQRGGEPDAARLLELARAELLRALLPQLDGDGRYRAKLIANALKIAAAELKAEPAADDSARALCRAVRRGERDGDAETHARIARLTEARRTALG